MLYCMLAAKHERSFHSNHHPYLAITYGPHAWPEILDGQRNGSRTDTAGESVSSGNVPRPIDDHVHTLGRALFDPLRLAE
jgi:hypothetical protein